MDLSALLLAASVEVARVSPPSGLASLLNAALPATAPFSPSDAAQQFSEAPTGQLGKRSRDQVDALGPAGSGTVSPSGSRGAPGAPAAATDLVGTASLRGLQFGTTLAGPALHAWPTLATACAAPSHPPPSLHFAEAPSQSLAPVDASSSIAWFDELDRAEPTLPMGVAGVNAKGKGKRKVRIDDDVDVMNYDEPEPSEPELGDEGSGDEYNEGHPAKPSSSSSRGERRKHTPEETRAARVKGGKARWAKQAERDKAAGVVVKAKRSHKRQPDGTGARRVPAVASSSTLPALPTPTSSQASAKPVVLPKPALVTESYTPQQSDFDEEDDGDEYGRTSRRKGKSRAAKELAQRYLDDDERDDRLYCVCLTLYDPNRMMIACDQCEDWYHTDCVHIQDAAVELLDQFICPKCETDSKLRTTWKVRCARPTCVNSVAPLSKYCSDFCGIEVAATRLELSGVDPEAFWSSVVGARRKEGVVIEGTPALPGPPAPAPTPDGDVAMLDADPPAAPLSAAAASRQAAIDRRALAALDEKLAQVVTGRENLDRALVLVFARLRYLKLVIRRWESVCQASANASNAAASAAATKAAKERQKRSKKGGGPASGLAINASTAQCGFDARLVYDDAEWASWLVSDEGKQVCSDWDDREGVLSGEEGMEIVEGVCATIKKKCERHVGWQKLREADYDVERAVLIRRLARLALQEKVVRDEIAEQKETTTFRALNAGRKASKPIKVEGYMLTDPPRPVKEPSPELVVDVLALPPLPAALELPELSVIVVATEVPPVAVSVVEEPVLQNGERLSEAVDMPVDEGDKIEQSTEVEMIKEE